MVRPSGLSPPPPAPSSEVGQLGRAIAADQDVGGLDVAMDDAHAVGMLKAPGDLQDEACGLRPLQPLGLVEHAGQGLALDILHHQVVHAALEAAIVDAHHVGMLHLGAELGFALEALHHPGIACRLAREHLDRDPPADRQLLGFIDHPDRPGSEAPDQAAAAQLLADQLVIRTGFGADVDWTPAVRTGDALADQAVGNAEFVGAGAAGLEVGGSHELPYREPWTIFQGHAGTSRVPDRPHRSRARSCHGR
jgi:hypothetical protein